MIYLIRHGETEWTKSKQHTSKTDISLTDQGRKEALLIKKRLEGISFDHVFTSPLKRALETCALAGFQGTVEPALHEWDYGDYEGLTSQTIKKNNPNWNLFKEGCPHGESPEAITQRIDTFLKKLPQGNSILFAHGHVLRAIAARWVGEPVLMGLFLALSPGSLSILGFEHERPVITLWNEIAN